MILEDGSLCKFARLSSLHSNLSFSSTKILQE
nr:MAG TPA: hypothetical protein [Crassvirales sp.]